MAESNRRLADIFASERGRLTRFVRRRIPDPAEAEDILQDVFFQLVQASRLPAPIEQVGAWLFRVARNRIVDRFRKKREATLPVTDAGEDGESGYWLDQALPAADDDPEAALLRSMLLAAIAAALEELPQKERDVFVAHELEGLSFKELSARSGVGVNTLLGWKRRAVLQLRDRLQTVRDEFFDEE